MNKIIIPLGLTDDNELISLTYGHNSVQNSTNVLLEGGPASGRQELIYNMMYSLLTNYSSKEVLIYDVCSGKEWTYTVRHYRNVRIADKGDTMVSFLEFILREVNDRKATRKQLPYIFLFFDYINEYSLSRRQPKEHAQRCVQLLDILLENGPDVGVFFICSCSWGDTKKMDNSSHRYNTIIRIPEKLLSMCGDLEIIAINSTKQNNKHFNVQKIYGKNFYKSMRRQLSFPIYYIHIIKRHMLNYKLVP